MLSSSTLEPFTAFGNAEYERVLAFLHNDKSFIACLLRARALQRLRLFERAYIEIEQASLLNLTAHQAYQVEVTRAVLLARLGREEESRQSLGTASEVLARTNDPLLALQFQWTLIQVDYFRGYLERTQIAIERLLPDLKVKSLVRPHHVFQPDVFSILASATTMLGIMRAVQGRFEEAENLHAEALLAAEASSPHDSGLEAQIVANLSCVLGDVHSTRALQLLVNRSSRIQWNASLDLKRVYVRRHLQRAAYLYGERPNAATLGGLSAHSLACRLGECVDALLLNDWSDREAFTTELSFAKALSDAVEWHSLSGEEFTSLSSLAVLLANRETEHAEKLQKTYFEALDLSNPHLQTRRCDTARAQEYFAAGCIAKARFSAKDAIRNFSNALKIWSIHNIRWKSAIVGIELYTLQPIAHALEPAEEFVRAYPQAPFSRRLSRALNRAKVAKYDEFPYLELSLHS